MLRVSAATGEGIDGWVRWLQARRAASVVRAQFSPHHAEGHRHG